MNAFAEKLLRGTTGGPWEYRPLEHDDWGFVRAPNEQGRFAGGIICQAYDPGARDELTLARHREARTDPWEANARLIASAPQLAEVLGEVVEAAQALVDGAVRTYTARNGRKVGIEADDGEACDIVHSDLTYALRAALSRAHALAEAGE